MKKKLVTIILAGALTVSSAFTALAGWEQTGTTWKYQNNDGSYIMNQWVWLDGNNDGIFESYCFDGNGDLYISTTTPDGYIVNENGAWTVNGITQTRQQPEVETEQQTKAETQPEVTTPPAESQPPVSETPTIWDGSMPGSNSGTPSMDGGNTSNDSPFRVIQDIDTYDPGDIGLGIN